MGRILRTALPLLLLAAVAAAAWLAFTGSRALAAVGDLQTVVDDLRAAVEAGDAAALEQAATEAQDAATRADDALDDPGWAAVAAVPYLGDTAEAARVTADAVATAAGGLDPLLGVFDVLDPASLYAEGRLAVERLEAAQQPLAQSVAAVEKAGEIIAAAPTRDEGAWVLDAVDATRAETAGELGDAAEALSTGSAAANVMPALFGSQGPRRWFVGLQSPAEARGTGGVVGTYLILRADNGRLELDRVGSNSDFGLLSALPDFGDQYRFRYGEDPRLFANSNLSPHFPYAAELWQHFYSETSLSDPADVVMGTDVVALGSLIDAIGPIALPDGRRLTADDAVQFALSGVYSAYPDTRAREGFQEAVARTIFSALTSGSVPGDELLEAFASIVEDRRLTLWSPVPAEQEILLKLPTSGSVAAEAGPFAHVAVNNGSASKLDTYLDRAITYRAGRCPADGRVRSTVEVILTSDIPVDHVLDDYVVSGARQGPDGPISLAQVQVHLSEEAAVDSITVDGQPPQPYAFREQGRPVVYVEVMLRPRQPATIRLEINESETAVPASVPIQPLAREATVSISDVPCTSEQES